MQVNGEQVTLETPVSVADYLEAHGFRAERVHIFCYPEITPDNSTPADCYTPQYGSI